MDVPVGLTPRERAVAVSAATGSSTREIAEDLHISPRTVEHHLAAVYRKLGVRSRAALATRLADSPQEQGPDAVTRFAAVGDGSVAYRVWGRGPTVVAIVVGPVSHVEVLPEDPSFGDLVRRLTGLGRVVLLDRRGVGLSDEATSPEPDLGDWITDIEAVLDAVGGERVVLLGVSDGAQGALALASERPGRLAGLVTAGGFASLRGRAHGVRAGLLGRIADRWGDGSSLGLLDPVAARRDEVRGRLGRLERFAAPPRRARHLLAAPLDEDMEQQLANVHVPALVLQASDDPVLDEDDARHLAAGLSGAELATVPGLDHHAWFWEVDAVAEQIGRFVDGLVPEGQEPSEISAVLFVSEPAAALRAAGSAGHVRPVEGDGAALLCARPQDALEAAASLLARGTVQRCVLHVGEVVHTASGLAGVAIEVSRRIHELAVGGPLLATGTFADLISVSGWRFEPVTAVLGPAGRRWPVVAVTPPLSSPRSEARETLR